MKKVLVLVLVLSLVLGSFSFAFAAGSTTDFEDTKGLDCEGAVAVLSALGVISGYPDGTYKPEGIVTRAEMAKLIIVALGLEDYTDGMYSSFPDVPGSHWATGYVAYAVSLGIIEGYPDGTFRPESIVSYQEAVTMIVRALGYQDKYLSGSWPASHVNQAIALDILKNIKATALGANRGDIARLLYNSLVCNIISYDSLGQIASVDDTMLARLGAAKVTMTVDQQDVYDAVTNIDNYLGARVKAWVIDDDDSDDDGHILVVEKMVSTFLTGEYDVKDGEFTTADKTYKFKNDVDQMYYSTGDAFAGWIDDDDDGYIALPFFNGAVDATPTVEQWNESTDTSFTIAVETSGNYITDVYSVGRWVASATVQWDDDYADELADDQSIEDYDFELDDDDAIDTKWFKLLGADSLDKLAEDDVVSVYYSDAIDQITKVEVGTETVVGKITKISSDAKKVTIDGTTYKLAGANSKWYVGPEEAPALADEGTFYLTYGGKIAFFDEDDSAGNYAVQLNAVYTAGSAKGSDYQVYMLTKDNEQNVFGMKDAVGDAFASTGNNVIGNVATIKTNASGTITALDEVNLMDASGLKLKANGYLNGKPISDDVVVFVCSADDEEDWYVGKLSDITTADELVDTEYALNKEGKKIDLIVVWDSKDVGASDDFGFITSYTNDYNDDEEYVFSGTALIDGAAVDFITTDDDEITTEKLGAYNNLYVIEYSGDAIDNLIALEAGTDVFTSADAISDDFGDTVKALYYTGTGEPDVEFGGSLTEFYQVLSKDGSSLNFLDDADYQNVADAAFYQVVLKDTDLFSKLKVGSLSSCKKGCYAMLIQTDEDSDGWDTVIYITADDYADYIDAIAL